MKTFIRFGRRVAVPSTVQIRHELRAICAAEDVREECAQALGLTKQTSWDEIYAERTNQAARTAS